MSTNIYSIYKATNIITNQYYIGFDSNWPKRQKQHKNESFNKNLKSFHHYFHRAIRKYGWDSFQWEVIYQSLDGDHCLKEMENHFIKEYDSFNNGYNMTLGGEGTIGYCQPRMYGNTNPMVILRTHSGSFKKGISLPQTKEHTEKIRQAKLGNKNPNYKNPLAANPLNQKKQCSICGVITNLGNLKRWHKHID